METASWSMRPILVRIRFAIDFLTSRITSCFFRSDCARGGAFLNWKLAGEIETIGDEEGEPRRT